MPTLCLSEDRIFLRCPTLQQEHMPPSPSNDREHAMVETSFGFWPSFSLCPRVSSPVSRHRNVLVRKCAAEHLLTTMEQIGAQKLLSNSRYRTELLLRAVVKLAQDCNQGTRWWSSFQLLKYENCWTINDKTTKEWKVKWILRTLLCNVGNVVWGDDYTG